MFKIIKIFEVFVDTLPKLTYIMDQLSNRIAYWFKNETSALNKVNFIELNRDYIDNSPSQSIWFIFNDEKYLYKIIITMNVTTLETCNLMIYKYENGNEFNLYPQKYLENNINVNDIKEDFILNKISKMDDVDKNPDENRIDTKEPEKIVGDNDSMDQQQSQPQPQGFQSEDAF